jgi:DNA-binding NtrC family response regulator
MDDIPLLAKHFVELSAKELKCAKPRLTRAAVTQLQSYDWPGNIRELRNVVERLVILSAKTITGEDVESYVMPR